MLILDHKSMLEVVSRNELVNSVEQAVRMYEEGGFHMPDRTHIDYRGNTLLLMPCFTEKHMATKLVSLFPENKKRELPVLFGVMVLNDGNTGKPLAVLDGAALTALRTGAVGSVSIRHMASPHVKTLGIVGAGVQGFHQTLTACTQRDFETVYVYDLYTEKADQLCRKLAGILKGIQIKKTTGSEQLLRGSEVIITATTSREPVLPDKEEMYQGKHIVGIGSYKPDMREFPAALFKNIGTMVVDTDYAVEESGDLKIPLEKGWIQKEHIVTIGKVISGQISIKKGEPGEKGATVFKSVGMALFDLVVSEFIYRKAKEFGKGYEVKFETGEKNE